MRKWVDIFMLAIPTTILSKCGTRNVSLSIFPWKCLLKSVTTLQSLMNIKLSKPRFWPCHHHCSQFAISQPLTYVWVSLFLCCPNSGISHRLESCVLYWQLISQSFFLHVMTSGCHMTEGDEVSEARREPLVEGHVCKWRFQSRGQPSVADHVRQATGRGIGQTNWRTQGKSRNTWGGDIHKNIPSVLAHRIVLHGHNIYNYPFVPLLYISIFLVFCIAILNSLILTPPPPCPAIKVPSRLVHFYQCVFSQ